MLKQSPETSTRDGITGADFRGVTKAFNTEWVKGLLYKLTILNFPSYLAKTHVLVHWLRSVSTVFPVCQTTCRGMLAYVARVDSSPLCSSACMWMTFLHFPVNVEQAHYADETAVVATSQSPSLLVGYLEVYLSRLGRWLWDCRISNNVSKSTAVLFVKAAKRLRKPRGARFVVDPVQCVETALYLGLIIDTQLNFSVHVNQVKKRKLKDWACLAPSLTTEAACPSETVCCSTSSSSVLSYIKHVRSGGPQPRPESTRITIQVSSHCGKRTLVRQYQADSWGFGIPFFADHIRALTEFPLNVSWCGNPLVRQLRRHLCRPRADWSHPRVTEVD
jgi:hypothetical protein